MGYNEERKKLLKEEIKNIKKKQSKHYVPSILESARYDLVKSDNCSKSSLEKSSFVLVKKIRNK